jgi:predicted ester cyclase
MLAADSRVMVAITGRGTHLGEIKRLAFKLFPEVQLPPSGRKIEVSAIWVHDFTNERMRVTRGVFDGLTLLRQLGVIPALNENTY